MLISYGFVIVVCVWFFCGSIQTVCLVWFDFVVLKQCV
jgi:hypothetical protein